MPGPSGPLVCPSVRQNVALLEEEPDINQLTEFFSYEHFYVIYCKFWELDTDHDLLIDPQDLARHNDHGGDGDGGGQGLPSEHCTVPRPLGRACACGTWHLGCLRGHGGPPASTRLLRTVRVSCGVTPGGSRPRFCLAAISTKMIERVFSGAVTRYVSPGFRLFSRVTLATLCVCVQFCPTTPCV